MPKPGRVENPILEQSRKRKEIDKQRKHNNLNKRSTTLRIISIVIAALGLLLYVYYQNTEDTRQTDKQQTNTRSTTSSQKSTVDGGDK